MVLAASGSTIITWWDSAPHGVQVALIGNAGIVIAALMTILSTVFVALYRLRRERLHKVEDLALEIKKGLLLAAVAGAQQAVSCIGSVANFGLSIEDVGQKLNDGIRDMAAAAAVAGIPTVACGRKLMDAIGPSYLNILHARVPIEERRGHVAVLMKSQNALFDQAEGLISKQEAALAIDDRRALELLKQQWSLNRELLAERRDELRKLDTEIDEMTLEFLPKAMRAQMAIDPLLLDFIACVRTEILSNGAHASAFLVAATPNMDAFEKFIAGMARPTKTINQ